jgi:hypothetical protein
MCVLVWGRVNVFVERVFMCEYVHVHVHCMYIYFEMYVRRYYIIIIYLDVIRTEKVQSMCCVTALKSS